MRARHFDAALLANDALIADFLVLAAIAFVIFGRSENSFGKQAILFRPLGAVIQSLGLDYFAVRPGENFFGARQTDGYGFEIVVIHPVRDRMRSKAHP